MCVPYSKTAFKNKIKRFYWNHPHIDAILSKFWPSVFIRARIMTKCSNCTLSNTIFVKHWSHIYTGTIQHFPRKIGQLNDEKWRQNAQKVAQKRWIYFFVAFNKRSCLCLVVQFWKQIESKQRLASTCKLNQISWIPINISHMW